jgi:hypothetical protein
MADDTAPVIAHIGPGSIDMAGVGIPLSQIPLPVIYFDNAPALSHLNGVIGINTGRNRNRPHPKRHYQRCFGSCSPEVQCPCRYGVARSLGWRVASCSAR